MNVVFIFLGNRRSFPSLCCFFININNKMSGDYCIDEELILGSERALQNLYEKFSRVSKVLNQNDLT